MSELSIPITNLLFFSPISKKDAEPAKQSIIIEFSLEEKKEMIKEAVIENRQGNREKMDKLDELVKKLEEAARNGDKEAVAELKEWHETASLIEGSY